MNGIWRGAARHRIGIEICAARFGRAHESRSRRAFPGDLLARRARSRHRRFQLAAGRCRISRQRICRTPCANPGSSGASSSFQRATPRLHRFIARSANHRHRGAAADRTSFGCSNGQRSHLLRRSVLSGRAAGRAHPCARPSTRQGPPSPPGAGGARHGIGPRSPLRQGDGTEAGLVRSALVFPGRHRQPRQHEAKPPRWRSAGNPTSATGPWRCRPCRGRSPPPTE